ncbi:MAG: hypothetical protein LAT83_19340 [Kiritimatiellae bacterium]|nr:hypothetical protein [Kiritimatiellia bacterium]
MNPLSVRRTKHMNQYENRPSLIESEPPPDIYGMFLKFLRSVASVAGVIAIILGISYAFSLLGLIRSNITSPDTAGPLIQEWAEQFGGSDLQVMIGEQNVPLALIFAIVFVGGGAFVLAWLSLALVVVGSRVLSWTLTDRAAIQKILTHTFGPAPQTPQIQQNTRAEKGRGTQHILPE